MLDLFLRTPPTSFAHPPDIEIVKNMLELRIPARCGATAVNAIFSFFNFFSAFPAQ
jgi:hypothetical protein